MSTKIIISPIISNNHLPVGIVHENGNNCWTLLLAPPTHGSDYLCLLCESIFEARLGHIMYDIHDIIHVVMEYLSYIQYVHYNISGITYLKFRLVILYFPCTLAAWVRRTLSLSIGDFGTH